MANEPIKEMIFWRHPWEAIPPFNQRILFHINTPEGYGTYYGYFNEDDRRFYIYNKLGGWSYDQVWAWADVPNFTNTDVYNTSEEIVDFANRALKKGE